ncbi:riboflavin transporter 2-like [Diadema antillarum]|uniref:riboflavin transporter 2-like n=1 Tax=Diadema antillarum TaxID=105358 RepID=UPI003A8B84FC
MSCNRWLLEALTSLLVLTFGTSTWVALGGIWVELPLLTNLGFPEGYKTGSYVIVITQAAAIGPLIFVGLQYLTPRHCRLEIHTIYVILALGATASFLLIFFWDATSFWPLDHSDHSTAFLVLTFFMSLVDSTSNLTFIPFVSWLKSKYLNWYFIGEGLSSVIPSFVVLIQGSGGYGNCEANFTYINATFYPQTNTTVVENCTQWVVGGDRNERFSPQIYFTFIFILFALSTLSFCLLRWLPFLRSQYDETDDSNTRLESAESQNGQCCCYCSFCNHDNASDDDDEEEAPLLTPRSEEHDSAINDEDLQNGGQDINSGTALPNGNQTYNSLDPASDLHPALLDGNIVDGSRETSVDHIDVDRECSSSAGDTQPTDSGATTPCCSAGYVFLFIVLTLISAATYGVLPSIQSYSAGAYGADIYLLVTTCAEISVPVGYLLVTIRPTTNYLVVALTSAGGLAAGAYCMVTASLSPTPPFQDHPLGKGLIILAWILQGLFFSYCRATVGWILRGEEDSRKLLMWFGGCTTIGTMLGAFIMFPLVSVLGFFTDFDPDPCKDLPTCVVQELVIGV